MQGTRLPDAEMGIPGPGWEAWGERPDGCGEMTAPPGAYMKVTSRSADGAHVSVRWYARDPNGDALSIAGNHQVVEHEDGTITVTPSIINPNGTFHGWLQRGAWS